MKRVLQGGTGEIVEKKSRFIAQVFDIEDEDNAGDYINNVKKKYWDARHNCWAFVLGENNQIQRFSDDGEPGGTAGKPILGQINSNELTDILIVVVRYFGGIKLGTSGLIVAYKAAAAEALASAEVVTRTVDEVVRFSFEYPMMNEVMRVVKEMEPKILEQGYDQDCLMALQIRRSRMETLRQRLLKVDTLRIIE